MSGSGASGAGAGRPMRRRPLRVRLAAPAVAVAVLIAGYALLSGREPAMVEEAGTEPALPPFFTGDPQAVAAIMLHHTGLTLQRRSIPETSPETDAAFDWHYPAAPDVPLRESQVLQVVEAAIGLRPLRVIADEPADLAPYGLDAPRGRMELASAGGERLTILLGAPTATDTGYAMVEGRPAVYTVSAAAAYLLSREPAALIDAALPTFEPVLVRRLRVRGPHGELRVRFDAFHDASQAAERAAYLLTAPYAAPVPVDDAALRAVLARLREDLTGDVADGIVAEAAADDPALGLSEPTFELEVEDADGSYHLLVGAPAGAHHRYAALAGRPAVYRLGDSRVAALDRLRPFDLVARAAAPVDYDLVREVVFTARGKSYRMTVDREGEGMRAPVYRLDRTPLAAIDAAELLDLLNGLRMEGDTAGDAPAAGRQPVLEITWRLSKPELPAWSIGFLPHDGDFYAVRRGAGGAAAPFLIDRRAVDALADLIARLAGSTATG